MNTRIVYCESTYKPNTYGKRYSSAMRNMVAKLYLDKMCSVKDLARFYKVDPSSVYYWISSYKWQKAALTKGNSINDNVHARV